MIKTKGRDEHNVADYHSLPRPSPVLPYKAVVSEQLLILMYHDVLNSLEEGCSANVRIRIDALAVPENLIY